MSPEQARGESLDARSDLFSLGSVLYTMATGRPPFRAESTYGILRRITDASPRPIREISPQIPAWLAAIINKSLAKKPAERFNSATEVAKLLEQCLAHVQQPTVVPLPEFCGSGNRWSWLNTRRMALISGVLIIFIAAQFWIWQPKRRAGGVNPLVNSVDESPPVNLEDPKQQSAEVPSPPDESVLQWDPISQTLDQLDRDGVPFETRVDLLWDRQPLPKSQDSSQDSGSKPDKEFKP
ncbi:MAG: prkC 10, partial [Planctomycetaceae bacterium]|nr:prkC 10 [Planctomycetaceae bacterium]